MSRHFKDSTPIYLQIAEEVRTQILSGDLSDGDRLTSTTEYATRYRINPATANRPSRFWLMKGSSSSGAASGCSWHWEPRNACAANEPARTWTPLLVRPCTRGESWD